jgi:hypothetical protein
MFSWFSFPLTFWVGNVREALGHYFDFQGYAFRVLIFFVYAFLVLIIFKTQRLLLNSHTIVGSCFILSFFVVSFTL